MLSCYSPGIINNLIFELCFVYCSCECVCLKKRIRGSGLGILKRGIIMFPKIGDWGGSEGQGELISAIE